MPTQTGRVADANGATTEYLIDTNFGTVTGLKGIPVAGPPGTPQKVIRVHAPYTVKTVTWTCERLGGKPILPHWDTGDPNDVLVERNITPANPLLGANGGYIWRISGRYVYHLRLPPADTASLPAGGTPYDPDPANLQVVDGDLFSRDLLRSRVQTIPTQGTNLTSALG